MDIKNKIMMNSMQVKAMSSLLATVDRNHNSPVDIWECERDIDIYVTVWRAGEPTSWKIESDGHTSEF